MSAAADPRRDAVQSGVALVMRGLLQTMYAYCKGPPSTPQIEAELGKQLIEAGHVLRCCGQCSKSRLGDPSSPDYSVRWSAIETAAFSTDVRYLG